MSEPLSNRQQPTRGHPQLCELTLIVRPAGRPTAIRCFTGAERAEAELYATETGAVVETLPLH